MEWIWVAFLTVTIAGSTVFAASALRASRRRDAPRPEPPLDPARLQALAERRDVPAVLAEMRTRIESLEAEVEDLSHRVGTLADDGEYLQRLLENGDELPRGRRSPP